MYATSTVICILSPPNVYIAVVSAVHTLETDFTVMISDIRNKLLRLTSIPVLGVKECKSGSSSSDW